MLLVRKRSISWECKNSTAPAISSFSAVSVMLTGAEVKAHSTRASCWVIINNAAYDVTDYLDEHPGGANIILRYGGKVKNSRGM